jgi:AcrR family transcriptional regulator
MPPQRNSPTRAQTQARTRNALLSTAARLFLRDGYGATSLERVAAEAGYSKGAVYSNFASKEALCLAVIERRHEEAYAALGAAMTAEHDVEQRLQALERWWEEHSGDQRWAKLQVEFAVLAGDGHGVQDALAARNRAQREVIAALLATQLESLGVELTIPLETLAMALHAFGVGLVIERLADPGVPATALGTTLRALVAALSPRA